MGAPHASGAEAGDAAARPTRSALSPLRLPVYRRLWLASLVSNLGTWMHEAAGAWLMTMLSPSPLLVALMQTAASLPFFLLAFPAGALADVVDRRRVLLITQAWMLVAAAALGVLAIAGLVTPLVLLALTFALGVGSAMTSPAWQAITPELVSTRDLPAAIALGGVAFNLARAVGPALGGLATASVGPGMVFLLNAASFLAVLAVLATWRRTAPRRFEVPEDVFGAMRAGARYVRHSLPLRTVLARSASFVLFASAVWSLLPLVARQLFGLGAVGYGLLLGCLGLGAVAGATVLPWLRRRFPIDRLMVAAAAAFALCSATLAMVREPVVAGIVLLAGGAAWMATMSTINTAAQTSVSAWVRARALSVSLLVIQGSMALGALLWGSVAVHAGLPAALLMAAGGLLIGLILVSRFQLGASEGLDLTLADPVPAPSLAGDLAADGGPVLVTVEYAIEPERAEEFVHAIRRLARVRRRDGAQLWGVFRDAEDPARYLETFTVESWAEHLRQHERMTVADRELVAIVRSFHVGDQPPLVTHLIAAPLKES
jgi:predicted MFS family arabinose efflux permease